MRHTVAILETIARGHVAILENDEKFVTRYPSRMLSEWLRNAMKAAGMSQAQLARELTDALGRSIDRAHLRLLPVEWRPRRQHRNPASASNDLKLLTLVDRWHSFEDNAPLGINGFNQTQTGIARDLPRAISSFSDYLNLASEIWKLPDLRTIAPPPWSKTLL